MIDREKCNPDSTTTTNIAGCGRWRLQASLIVHILTRATATSLSPLAQQLPQTPWTSPNGGEIWYKYNTYGITWSYTASPGLSVKIVLLKGDTEINTIARSVPLGSNGKGSYSWFVPTTLVSGSDYKVSVQSVTIAHHQRRKQCKFQNLLGLTNLTSFFNAKNIQQFLSTFCWHGARHQGIANVYYFMKIINRLKKIKVKRIPGANLSRYSHKNFVMGTMKIAYLILAHNNYNHLKKLVNALNDGNGVFFIHIDNTLKLPDDLNESENVVFVRGPKVNWAGWSTVEAIISLLRTATKYGFDYYYFLSGADYPIRPNSFLYSQLSTGGEFMNIKKGFYNNKSEWRFKYYYFDGFDRRNIRSIKTVFFYLLEKSMRLFYQKKVFFKQIYVGSTWWGLSHDCCLFVLHFIDHDEEYKKYKRFFKTSWDSDESFFQTIIGNSPFYSKCKTHLTYQDWSANPAPVWINKNHVELFKKQTEFVGDYGKFMPFFARKFNDESTDVVESIEKELRK